MMSNHPNPKQANLYRQQRLPGGTNAHRRRPKLFKKKQ